MESRIRPGTFLVPTQVGSGIYETDALDECYWERLRGFSGDTGEIIASQFVTTPGKIQVEISSGDAGFKSHGRCGTWSRASNIAAPTARPPAVSPGDIQRNRALSRRGLARP
jgi:hypothetical protein